MTQTVDWNNVKQKIKAKFGKLNDAEIEKMNGHLDQLPEKIEKVYGYSKDKAKDECKEFTNLT